LLANTVSTGNRSSSDVTSTVAISLRLSRRLSESALSRGSIILFRIGLHHYAAHRSARSRNLSRRLRSRDWGVCRQVRVAPVPRLSKWFQCLFGDSSGVVRLLRKKPRQKGLLPTFVRCFAYHRPRFILAVKKLRVTRKLVRYRGFHRQRRSGFRKTFTSVYIPPGRHSKPDSRRPSSFRPRLCGERASRR